MAIQFFCQRCRRMLGIATRKAGTEIECPQCGLLQVVPTEEAAQVSLVMSQFSETANPLDPGSEVVVYHDEPADVEAPRSARVTEPDSPGTLPPPRRADSHSPKAPPRTPPKSPPLVGNQPPDTPLPSGMILLPRRSLYVQAILYAVIAGIGFGSGYFIGRGDASYDLKIAQEEASKESVLVEGKLMWEPSVDKLSGESGAVVIALPDGEPPEHLFSIIGLRPQDPPPSPHNKNVRQIEEFGGAYSRADQDGVFSILIPQQGKYRFLLIARHAARPKDQSINELELDQIRKYFLRAEDLISRYKYRWTEEEFLVGTEPIEYNFGIDRKDETTIDLGL